MRKKSYFWNYNSFKTYMDDTLKGVFFQLIRIGLWGKESLKLKKPLSEEDWLQVRSYALNHTVDGLIYDSFKYLNEDQLPPQSLRIKWAIRVDQIERHNSKMSEVIATQYTSFKNQGLNPLLQKGQGIAACYNIPNHRISGDIDWYFEDEGYIKARTFLKNKGINFTDTAGFSLEYDWKSIHIEHHKRLFDIHNPLKYRYLKRLKKIYQNKQQEILINSIPVKILAPELQLLQVNAHILKHLISFGIGLRQLCDSARLYNSVASQIDSKALKEIYQKAGILKWTHLLHIILVENLGLQKESIPFTYPEEWDASWMMEEIWHSGNFGFHDQRFENGAITPASVRPDGINRFWLNMKRYYRYAPKEVLFFPVVHLYSKIFGIDK